MFNNVLKHNNIYSHCSCMLLGSDGIAGMCENMETKGACHGVLETIRGAQTQRLPLQILCR